jgi:crossover junction endodeoxyribonuclease RuvC
MIVIGVDPGLSGGVAAIGDFGAPFLEVMPSIRAANRGVVDPGALARMLRRFGDDVRRGVECHAYLEQVHSMPQQGVSSSFKFGRAFGIVEGVLAGLGIPYTLVTPQRWQKEMLVGTEHGSTKERAAIAASRLFPDVELRASERSRKVHEGLADALLIAEFGRRLQERGQP